MESGYHMGSELGLRLRLWLGLGLVQRDILGAHTSAPSPGGLNACTHSSVWRARARSAAQTPR